MSAVAATPQALQDPAAESIKSPSVNRELKNVRILHHAFLHCPPEENIAGGVAVHFHSRYR